MSKKNPTKKMYSLNKESKKTQEEQLRTVEEITADYSRLCQEIGNRFVQFEIEKSIVLQRYQELNAEMQLTQKVMEASAKQKEDQAAKEVVAEETVTVEEAV